MANKEHLYILNQGIQKWNNWRKVAPSITPYLAGANLTNADLTNVNLTGVNLAYANLFNANLTNEIKSIDRDRELPRVLAIENQDDGDFVIRVTVPNNANQAEIESYLKKQYDRELKTLEEKYRWQLDFKEEKIQFYLNQIEEYRRQSTDIIEIMKFQATNKPNIYYPRY